MSFSDYMKVLLRRAWIIIILMVIGAGIGFATTPEAKVEPKKFDVKCMMVINVDLPDIRTGGTDEEPIKRAPTPSEITASINRYRDDAFGIWCSQTFRNAVVSEIAKDEANAELVKELNDDKMYLTNNLIFGSTSGANMYVKVTDTDTEKASIIVKATSKIMDEALDIADSEKYSIVEVKALDKDVTITETKVEKKDEATTPSAKKRIIIGLGIGLVLGAIIAFVVEFIRPKMPNSIRVCEYLDTALITEYYVDDEVQNEK